MKKVLRDCLKSCKRYLDKLIRLVFRSQRVEKINKHAWFSRAYPEEWTSEKEEALSSLIDNRIFRLFLDQSDRDIERLILEGEDINFIRGRKYQIHYMFRMAGYHNINGVKMPSSAKKDFDMKHLFDAMSSTK